MRTTLNSTLIAMCALGLAASVAAQTPPSGKICEPYGDSTVWSTSEFDNVIVSAPADAAAAKNSTRMNVEANGVGITTYWYYTDGFSYRVQWQAVTYEFLRANLIDMSKDLVAARAAADPVAAAKAYETKWSSVSPFSPTLLPVWCPHWAKIRANMPPPVPYIVKPAPGYTLRYTYVFDPVTKKRGASNGTISIKTGTAPTACNAVLARVVEGTQVYASVKGVATTVTACDKG